MKTDLDVLLPGGKTGILLLHDVGGSAAELRGQAGALARCGYTVHCPQLIGLGPSGVAGQGSAGMLVSEAEHALSRLRTRCESVVVIGIAYGAMLALELARHNAGAVQAVVLADPRAWLPTLRLPLPAALSGRISQTMLGRVLSLPRRLVPAQATARMQFSPLANGGPHAGATMVGIGKLLDSVHAGLPSVRQPVLLLHPTSAARKGSSGSFLLQRRLGGRVESVMMDGLRPGAVQHGRHEDVLAERADRFIATVLEEIETRRSNEARRQKVAAGRTSAA